MPDYIKIRHDQLILDYFEKTKSWTGASMDLMVYPLTSQGFMKLGYGDIKVVPSLDKGVVMFTLLYLIDVKDLLEKNGEDCEELEFITYLQNSGEVLGISEGMAKYGIDPEIFTEANPERKPKIDDFFL